MNNVKIKTAMVNELGFIEVVEVGSKRYYELLCVKLEHEVNRIEKENEELKKEILITMEEIWNSKD